MTNKKISILGCGIGRFGTALLAKKKNFDVFVSEKNSIPKSYKDQFYSLNIDFEEHKNSIGRILQCDILIKSPGIPLDNLIIIEAQKKNILVLDEIAFAAQYTDAKLIGITGTNGKSTVVFMVEKILQEAKKKVEVCGNVEKSLALAIYEEHDVDIFVLELSSFQLECFNKTHLDIACIVNISENHLDHHKTFENYRNAKFNIRNGLTSEDFFIYDGDDKNIFCDTSAKKFPILHDEIKDFPQGILQNYGDHNIFDALLAKKICEALHVDKEIIFEGLKKFKSLPHRIEFVCEINKISFYNDSKSTSVASTIAAINFILKKHCDGKIILLLGGFDKGNDYHKLSKFSHVLKKIICIGHNNKKILNVFGNELCIEEVDINKTVELAYNFSERGDVVLLSPACASLDFYKNFWERGEKFTNAVLLLRKNIN